MEDDLELTGNRYSIALLIFFIGYLLGEVRIHSVSLTCMSRGLTPTVTVDQVPSNMILSRSRPSLYLPAIMLVWGVVGGLFATIQSYHGLVIARFFLVRRRPMLILILAR